MLGNYISSKNEESVLPIGSGALLDQAKDITRASRIGGAALTFRMPRAEDGPAISQLIAECPPLDGNSAYCNLLQCTHFAETCVVAERDRKLVGWVSAYRTPTALHQLFVWQVAVRSFARGTGVGGRMLDTLLTRPASRGITTLTTTITERNAASWALFFAFGRRHGVEIVRRPMFDHDVHFAGSHETEHLVSIGPLTGGSE